MMTQTIICDKCRNEIKGGLLGINKEALDPIVNGYHLCNNCLDVFMDWIKSSSSSF